MKDNGIRSSPHLENRQPRLKRQLLSLANGCLIASLFVVFSVRAETKEPSECAPRNTIKAAVVALEQVYFYNRFGAFNPAGMIYALRRDVVANEDIKEDNLHLKENEQIPEVNDPEKDRLLRGGVKLRADKRPRPLVLRVHEGDCLEVTFTNLLRGAPDGQEVFQRDLQTGLFNIGGQEIDIKDPKQPRVMVLDGEDPTTRHASMHVNGLNYVSVEGDSSGGIMSDGSNVGRNPPPITQTPKTGHNICTSKIEDFGKDQCSLAAPGETRVYRWYAKKEGGYLFYSMGGPAGGEGDGGQLSLGLFGSVNVQPKGAKWYRSQVTEEDLDLATTGKTMFGQPKINYEAEFTKGPRKGEPILNMLKCKRGNAAAHDCEIIYSDLNAVIDLPEGESNCGQQGEGGSCGKPYREFTSIFHDEITAVQAFRELSEEDEPIAKLKDGMAINYGASGLGAMVLANRAGVGPAADCPECKLEEFFLASWANGDPALVLGAKRKANGDAVYKKTKNGKILNDKRTGKPLIELEAKYPDDPSNVHHSYIGDPIRFRNMHAGPKETHVFHLHAHQWVQDKQDPDSVYLDSQTISPGATFSYEIHYGGSGNRNFTPGDSIFHCHLYPHFAQGMWELWRSHDVFENGTKGLFDAKKPISKQNQPGMRNLPDGEIADGTPNPAIVPLPRAPMPPMPGKEFRGYPFYIAGEAGHRPPQPPLDLEVEAKPDEKTLQRHIILGGRVKKSPTAIKEMQASPTGTRCKFDDLYCKGLQDSATIAKSVRHRNNKLEFVSLARELETARIKVLPHGGTPDERAAMSFHEGELVINGSKATNKTDPDYGWTNYNFDARGYPTCDSAGNCNSPGNPILFHVNGREPKPGAPYADPCPKNFYDASGHEHAMQTRHYRAAYIQFDMQVNKEGWHDPQARIAVLEQDVKDTLDRKRPTEPLFFRAKSGECIEFAATNLVPSNLNLDDFQIFSPTDVIGQHIHLVKFDVTSSDGSGNGWNYEDGTLAADEVRERIAANNRYQKKIGGSQILRPRTHSMFKSGGAMQGDARGFCPNTLDPEKWNEHPWCGAQTTIQRWWADPLLNKRAGEDGAKDRTLRTVFTHDHFGPSSHQHHGLYAALVIEPSNSKWTYPDGRIMGGSDASGKPVEILETIIDNGKPLTRKRTDGGPTSYAANIIVHQKGTACIDNPDPRCNQALDATMVDKERTAREFNLAFADFAIVYDKENRPINPPNRIDRDLPLPSISGPIPAPEGISASDPGTQLINYRNEPIPLRIGVKDTSGNQDKNENQYKQKVGNPEKCKVLLDETINHKCTVEKDEISCKAIADAETECDPGNMANVFSSKVHANQAHNGTFQIAKTKKGEIFTESLIKNWREPGDPATPLLRAYAGDRVQIRLIQGAQEENHMFSMHGVKWLAQPASKNSGYMNGQPIGISEHFEFDVNVDTVKPERNADYLYSSWAADNLWDGQWGILRSFGWNSKVNGLARLPSNPLQTTELPSARSVCPSEAPERLIWVEAGPATIVYNHDRRGENQDRANIQDEFAIVFKRTKEKIREPGRIPETVCDNDDPTVPRCSYKLNNEPLQEPLILRARANDCIHVTLKNKLPSVPADTLQVCNDPHGCTDPNNPAHTAYLNYKKTWSFNSLPPTTPGFNFNQLASSNRVSLHPQLLAVNTHDDDGSKVGLNKDSTVPNRKNPEVISYRWYAGNLKLDNYRATEDPVEFGIVGLRDMGDVIKHSSHGAIGALIVEPQCSTWVEDPDTKASATVTHWEPFKDREGRPSCQHVPENQQHFREFVLLYQDDLSLQHNGQALSNLRNADDAEDTGQKAFNYRTEPIWARLGADPGVEPDQMLELDWSNAFSSYASNFHCKADPANGKFCDPETPVFSAKAGTPVRFRVAHVQGKPRNHGFTLFGHDWSTYPWECDPKDKNKLSCDSTKQGVNMYSSNRVGSVNGIGPSRHINILTQAGGDFSVPGDYMYRTQEGFQFGGGLWGIFRVCDGTDPKFDIACNELKK